MENEIVQDGELGGRTGVRGASVFTVRLNSLLSRAPWWTSSSKGGDLSPGERSLHPNTGPMLNWPLVH